MGLGCHRAWQSISESVIVSFILHSATIMSLLRNHVKVRVFMPSMCAQLPAGAGMYPVWQLSILDAPPMHRHDTWVVCPLQQPQPEFSCRQCSNYSDGTFNMSLHWYVLRHAEKNTSASWMYCNLMAFNNISLSWLTSPTQETWLVTMLKFSKDCIMQSPWNKSLTFRSLCHCRSLFGLVLSWLPHCLGW